MVLFSVGINLTHSHCSPTVMRKFAVGLLLFSLWQSQAYALSQQDQVLLKSALKIALSANLPTVSNGSLSLDQAQQQLVQAVGLLGKIADSSDVLQKILAIRDGLYTSDGDTFRAILVTAASSKEGRDAFIAGLQYEKCKKWFWQCGLPPISWDKLKFKFVSKIKGDIDALEEKLIQLGAIKDDDLSGFDPKSLDPYEEYFRLYVQLEPLLGRLSSSLFGYYTQKSLRDFNENELRDIFKKLIEFLNDNEDGALGYIRKANPRS